MAEIPGFDPQVDIHPSFTPETSPQARALPGEAIASAGKEFGSVMEEFNARYQDAKRAANLSTLMASASSQLNEAYFKWSRTADRKAAGDGFAKDSQAIFQKATQGIDDPLLLQHFKASYQAESVGRQLETEDSAFKLEIDKHKGDLDQSLFNFATSAASVKDPILRGKIIDEGTRAIDGAQQAGWINGDEAAEKRIHFASEQQRIPAEQMIDHAVQTQDPKDSAAASAAISDPKNFPGLDPQVRESLLFRVDRLNDRFEQRAIARQAHEDAVAERGMHQAQSHNEAIILGGVYNGKAIDRGLLEKLADTGQISPGGLETIMGAMDRTQAGHDDPVTAMTLWNRIDTGHATQQDVYDQVHAGNLKAETAVAMTRTLDAGSSPAGKDAAALLNRAITGSSDGLSGHIDGETRELAASAQAEFRRRLGAGEDPQRALSEIVPRYAPDVSSHLVLPQPKFGAVNDMKSLGAVAKATVAAHDKHEIDDAEYGRESELLKDYWRFYSAEQEMQKARKAAATKQAPLKQGSPE